MDLKGKRILVAQTAYIGDVVLTWPLLWRSHVISGQQVGLLTRPQCALLFEAAQDIVEIIPFDKRGQDKGLSGLLRVAKSLNGRFDIALSPHPSFRTSLFLKLAKIPIRIGFSNAQCSFLYSTQVAWDNRRHEVERQKLLLEAVAKAAANINDVPPIPASSAQKRRADELLKAAGVKEGKVLVAINPFSVWYTKRWPLGNWAKLAEFVEDKIDARVLVVGGASDANEADRLKKQSRAELLSLVGQTDLGVLNALMERISIFVSNDSGPAHVAAMQKVPTIVIFGSTTPELGYVPRGPNVDVVQIDLNCRPCGRHGHKRCPEVHFKCMKDITPEMVINAVLKQLAKNK